MSLDLRNSSGDSIRVSGGHWAVFLTLAQAFGWKPAGTKRPSNLPISQGWSGRYDSSDGQTVTDADAKLLAQVLHAAAVSPKLTVALPDVIRHIERQVEAGGAKIPEGMRMLPEHFSREFSPLLEFLYKGEFVIE
jgi:hypothetical protein